MSATWLALTAVACRQSPNKPITEASSPSSAREAPAKIPAPGHIRLRVLPAIAKENDALPRVVPNDAVSPATAAAINARFDRMDAETRKIRLECRTAEARMHPDTGPGDFETTVNVTMRGPRYLSLSIQGSSDCGGAHPDGYTTGLVLDTVTAQPIDWLPLLPGSKAGYNPRPPTDPISFNGHRSSRPPAPRPTRTAQQPTRTTMSNSPPGSMPTTAPS